MKTQTLNTPPAASGAQPPDAFASPGFDIFALAKPKEKIPVTIELTEEQAACIWANQTWGGTNAGELTEICTQILRDAASIYRRAFPSAVPRDVLKFRSAFGKGSEVAA